MLISSASTLYGQVGGADTLKKVAGDSLDGEDDIAQRIRYEAEDSTVAIPGSGRVFLYGKARVVYDPMSIEASVIEVDYEHNTVIAYGHKDSLGRTSGSPVFKNEGETMEAEKIMYNLRSKRGKIFNAMTKQGELIVIGNEIKKDSSNVIYMRDMRCIPCEEKNARTMFRATKAKIIPDDKIVTGPMYLEIGGVPTPLALPFGYFPNTKRGHSGIILPSYGFSETMGFRLQQGGFYWGINDRTDMLLKGDVYGNGSFAVNVQSNYNVIYKSSGSAALGFTQFDFGDKDVPKDFNRQRSYQVRWNHRQDNRANPDATFSADVNFVSNQQVNRFTSINTGQFLQNAFQSNINYTRNLKFGSLSMNARHDQTSVGKRMNIVLPSLTFNVNRFFPFRKEGRVRSSIVDKIGMNYLLEAQNILSGADSTILKSSPLDSMRYGIRHNFPISTNFNVLKYITVTPAINLSNVMQMRGVQRTYSTETGSLQTRITQGFQSYFNANFTTSMNTKFYFDYMFRGGGVKQVRHVLIPTLGYMYQPDFGDPQFGYWRQVQADSTGRRIYYSTFENGVFGVPARGKQNAVSINLFNNVEAKTRVRTDTGISYQKQTVIQQLGINTNYNFAADSFRLSDINISLRTKLLKIFDITYNSNYSPYVFDKYLNRRIQRYTFERGGLARFTSADITVNTSIGSNMVEAIRKARNPPDLTNAAERGTKKRLDETQPLPWNISANYTLRFLNDNVHIQPSHNLIMTGDVMPTKFWKLGVSSGFDFSTRQLSYTRVTLYRDLKCWEARIEWVPLGVNKSYVLVLNLKSGMLRDIPIQRTQMFMDSF